MGFVGLGTSMCAKAHKISLCVHRLYAVDMFGPQRDSTTAS